jgi:lysine/ornithine N-monooxygenase
MDVAKFSLEFTSPLSLSHFYRQDEGHKLDFLKHQYDLYKGINRNLLDRLYDLSYEDRLKGGERLHIHCHCYQPQQSIRTFFNHSAPYKRYVKVSRSILNMG